MRSAAIAFLCGTLVLLQLPELPDIRWCLLLVCLIPLLLLAVRLRFLIIVGCGFLLALWHVSPIVTATIPAELEGRDLIATGTISSLPRLTASGNHFDFTIEQLAADSHSVDFTGTVRLTWYRRQGPRPQVGERWQFRVRLKHPHGFANPGGFDYEAWLLQNHIVATGYIRDDRENRRLAPAKGWFYWHAWRQGLVRRLGHVLEGQSNAGVIMALAVGERSAIAPATWEVLLKTGTNHLVAISGLHIAAVSGFGFVVCRRLWAAIPYLALRWPAPAAGALLGLLLAFVYAALAGFSLPTRRALIMITVALLAIIWQRPHQSAQTLATALLAVLLIDPLAVLSASFWLSFTAVAIILFGMNNRLHAEQTLRQRWWWRWGRLHILIAIGLLPLLILLFQRFPLISPLANIIAVPWVSFLVIPPVLCGTLLLGISDGLAHVLLSLGSLTLATLWPLLSKLAANDMWQWTRHAQPWWTVVSAFVGTVMLLLPRGVPGRWIGVFCLLPMLLNPPPRPVVGGLKFALLDVGQGLASVVQTHNHVLVYDTGPRFSADFDTGNAVVVPYLRYYGWQRVDRLVIGHGDNDHIGGADSLRRQVPVLDILSSVAEKIPWASARPCLEQQHWRWDGVDFEILHPNGSRAWQGNDGSCVLRISNGEHTFLLTGDIEAFAEHRLATERAAAIDSDILVVPHHGSKTSSSAVFVAAVTPDHVLFPVGYHNRFGFPDPHVLERYQRRGAQIWRSDYDGAIEVTLFPGCEPFFSSYRKSLGHFYSMHALYH